MIKKYYILIIILGLLVLENCSHNDKNNLEVADSLNNSKQKTENSEQ